ncbi:hypothetical protein [Erythrobacter sp. HKB08]|uniref:hypothetical protein n=1 Tax=Erythrobacter sp. HKB08 TaxID=2502843 RepID=UPI00100937BA|nr:hypothetical protein [Erythrobacter sp. HKB08]
MADEGAQVVECALGEGSEFGPDCFIEFAEVEGATQVVIRHPDGGFRRFRVQSDLSGLEALDGADVATNSLGGDPQRLEVVVGTDRYRLPVRLDGNDEPQS